MVVCLLGIPFLVLNRDPASKFTFAAAMPTLTSNKSPHFVDPRLLANPLPTWFRGYPRRGYVFGG